MKHRAPAANLHFGYLAGMCALFPTLVLIVGCGGSATSTGDGPGSAGAGAGDAGGSHAGGVGNAGAPNGNAGAPSGATGGSGTLGASCTVDGVTYASGDSGFLGPDGCNHCSCLDGQLACTLLACELPPKRCGGIAATACASGEYCQYPLSAQCGAGDQTGTCAHPSTSCDDVYSPVCGCDGKQYGNACSAASAGVSVASMGACQVTPPGSCMVTVDGISYPDGSTDIPAGDGCNVCACTKGVLSCSGRPCKAPTPCGARAGDTCTASEYCAYAAGAACGAADAEAVCKPRPSACSTLYQPVCGCGAQKTYQNACSAALAGVGVSETGLCPGAGQSCTVGAATYVDGSAGIRAPDGCNTCSCTDGALACTQRACPPP